MTAVDYIFLYPYFVDEIEDEEEVDEPNIFLLLASLAIIRLLK